MNYASAMCTHHNTPGHTIDKCYKLHGYPPGYKTKQQQRNNNVVNSVAAQNSENISQDTTY